MTGSAGTPVDPGGTGPAPASTASTYEIRVAGHLDDHWAATLGDLTLVRLDDGTTSLTGPVLDQAHLHGVLAGVRDVGVPLLAVRTLDPGKDEASCPRRDEVSGREVVVSNSERGGCSIPAGCPGSL